MCFICIEAHNPRHCYKYYRLSCAQRFGEMHKLAMCTTCFGTNCIDEWIKKDVKRKRTCKRPKKILCYKRHFTGLLEAWECTKQDDLGQPRQFIGMQTYVRLRDVRVQLYHEALKKGTVSARVPCFICNADHSLLLCRKFTKLSCIERFEQMTKMCLCCFCLGMCLVDWLERADIRSFKFVMFHCRRQGELQRLCPRGLTTKQYWHSSAD